MLLDISHPFDAPAGGVKLPSPAPHLHRDEGETVPRLHTVRVWGKERGEGVLLRLVVLGAATSGQALWAFVGSTVECGFTSCTCP